MILALSLSLSKPYFFHGKAAMRILVIPKGTSRVVVPAPSSRAPFSIGLGGGGFTDPCELLPNTLEPSLIVQLLRAAAAASTSTHINGGAHVGPSNGLLLTLPPLLRWKVGVAMLVKARFQSSRCAVKERSTAEQLDPECPSSQKPPAAGLRTTFRDSFSGNANSRGPRRTAAALHAGLESPLGKG